MVIYVHLQLYRQMINIRLSKTIRIHKLMAVYFVFDEMMAVYFVFDENGRLLCYLKDECIYFSFCELDPFHQICESFIWNCSIHYCGEEYIVRSVEMKWRSYGQ